MTYVETSIFSLRQIGFTTHLYPTPSEIFSNPFKNSGLAYT